MIIPKKKIKRIGIAGISVEVLIDSPLFIGEAEMQIYRKNELIDRKLWMIRGMVECLKKNDDVEIVPLLWATALPGGIVTKNIYEFILNETITMLKDFGPFDAICLANHGALEVEGLDISGDTDFIAAIKKCVGPDVPVAIALDLHGNLTQEIVELGTVFSVLRTAPHRDDFNVGFCLVEQLINVLQNKIIPQTAMVNLPMIISGEQAVTDYNPAKSIYKSLENYDSMEGVMRSDILVGYAWNDRPWNCVSTLVTTENDFNKAKSLASEIAYDIWVKRNEFTFSMENASVDEGIARANSSKIIPVYLTDSGDNTTMGAPGDLTLVLQSMLTMKIIDAFVPGIYAPGIVRSCHQAGVGALIDLELGKEHISAPVEIMQVKALIEAIGNEMNLGGFQPYRTKENSQWAKVNINGIMVSFHDMPIGITTPGHFQAMGVEPDKYPINVLKLGYLHPQLEKFAKRHIMLISEGTGNLELRNRQWCQIKRPIFPLDPNMTWLPKQKYNIS